MNLAIDLNGGFGETVLVLYIVGGLALALTALARGMSSGSRTIRVVIGAVIVVWAGYVLLFGGWIIISWYVALLPFILAVQGILAAAKSRRSREPQAVPLPPGVPGPYPQFPAVPAPYPPAQQPAYPPAVQGGYPAPYAPPAQPGGYPPPQGAYPPAHGQGAYPPAQPQGGYPAPQYPQPGA